MAVNDNDMENVTETPKEKAPGGASKYIIPALGGAIIWVGLLGFGLNKIYSMSDKGQDKPTVETATSTPAEYATPSEQTTSSSKEKQGIDATSRFAIEMQDDHGMSYIVYLNAPQETSSVQPAPSTVAAAQGDKLFHGDYDTYVAPVGSTTFTKQAVTLPNMTFNLNRKQVYVLKGNPELLVITQPNNSNGITARFYTLINGVLTPVELVRGTDTKSQLYMMAMKANANDRTFVTVENDSPTGHWHFTTWKADPNNKVLRVVSTQDLTKEQMKTTDHKWWVTPSSSPVHANWSTGSTPSRSTAAPTHGGTTSGNSGSGNTTGGNGNSTGGPGSPTPPATNGGSSSDDGSSSTDGSSTDGSSTSGDLYGGYDNGDYTTDDDLYNGNGITTGGSLYGGYNSGNTNAINGNGSGSSAGSLTYDPSTWLH